MVYIDAKKYVLNTLNDKEIINLLPDKKVYFLHSINPNKKLYVEYEIYDSWGIYYTENAEKYRNYMVQVDIFSTDNYSAVEKTIREKMIQSGFNRGKEADLFEKDTKLYHKAMRFSITL